MKLTQKDIWKLEEAMRDEEMLNEAIEQAETDSNEYLNSDTQDYIKVYSF